jgi:hypothetical protein
MNIGLYATLCAICIASVWHGIRLTIYFRNTYPAIWAKFGFSGNGWWSRAEDEGKDLEGQRAFLKFMLSPARRALQDAYLNRMLSIGLTLSVVGVFLFVCVLVNWLSQWPSPQ